MLHYMINEQGHYLSVRDDIFKNIMNIVAMFSYIALVDVA